MNIVTVPEIDGKIFITQSAIDEIRSFQSTNIFDIFSENVKLSVINVEECYIELVNKAARKIGQNKLSIVDIEVIALALKLSENSDLILITDDYGLKNVAHFLKINSEGIKTTGGKKARKYRYKCSSCNNIYFQIIIDCEICGNTKFKRLRY